MDMRFLPSGDRAVTVEFGSTIDPKLNDYAIMLDAMLAKEPVEGVIETIPTYRSILVLFDPAIIGYDALCAEIAKRMEQQSMSAHEDGVLWEVPCCYGSYFGPDMETVCQHTGLSKKEIIERHCAKEYRIYMLGFLPGFVYLGGMDPSLTTPRLSSPRTRIPRGAVGIGGAQTGIYPMESPGGWNLIGCTPIELYDPAGENPVLFKAGDHIHFYPVTASEYYNIRQAIQRGEYRPVCTPLHQKEEE